jgi:hypothetical protein
MIDIKGRVSGPTKTHPMALAFLVLFPAEGAKGGAALELREALLRVGVWHKVARLGQSPFARTHAAHGEGAGDEGVSEGEEVLVPSP